MELTRERVAQLKDVLNRGTEYRLAPEVEALCDAYNALRSVDSVSVPEAMVDRFLQWPLPYSVCADLCATRQGYLRSGTNLLSAPEARQMLEHVLDAAEREGKG